LNPEQFAEFHCPYCGEPNEVLVEPTAGDQDYIEDCQVCCRPVELSLRLEGDGWSLEARRDQ
jgi:hypothetical protein